jgi:hypothetical protein
MQAEQGLDLAVFDTVAAMPPAGSESNVNAVLAAVKPLEQLTRAGVSILLLHHPRKDECLPGQAARGSGALSAYADILIEMRGIAGARSDDRRRRLHAWSRHDETPREWVIEITPDGQDYVDCPDALDDESAKAFEQLRLVLTSADQQMTLQNIVASWPRRPQPSEASVYRWLTSAVDRNLIVRHGKGVRGAPYRYQLPGRTLGWEWAPEDILPWLQQKP